MLLCWSVVGLTLWDDKAAVWLVLAVREGVIDGAFRDSEVIGFPCILEDRVDRLVGGVIEEGMLRTYDDKKPLVDGIFDGPGMDAESPEVRSSEVGIRAVGRSDERCERESRSDVPCTDRPVIESGLVDCSDEGRAAVPEALVCSPNVGSLDFTDREVGCSELTTEDKAPELMASEVEVEVESLPVGADWIDTLREAGLGFRLVKDEPKGLLGEKDIVVLSTRLECAGLIDWVTGILADVEMDALT